jgi:hypothetical protein
MEDVEFYQNEDKRKTIAVYNGCAFDAYADYLASTSTVSDVGMIDISSIPEEIIMPNEIRTISTCHGTDKWDPEVGKRQAFYKLLRSYNKMKFRAINRMIKSYADKSLAMTRTAGYYNNNIDRYTKMIRSPQGVKSNES